MIQVSDLAEKVQKHRRSWKLQVGKDFSEGKSYGGGGVLAASTQRLGHNPWRKQSKSCTDAEHGAAYTG
jgi:hypothetical protein